MLLSNVPRYYRMYLWHYIYIWFKTNRISRNVIEIIIEIFYKYEIDDEMEQIREYSDNLDNRFLRPPSINVFNIRHNMERMKQPAHFPLQDWNDESH